MPAFGGKCPGQSVTAPRELDENLLAVGFENHIGYQRITLNM